MTKAFRIALPLFGALLLAGCGDDPAELYARAQKSFAAQDFITARIDLTSALRDEPGNKAMLALLADTQLRLGDGEAARATLDKLARAGGGGDLYNTLLAAAQLLLDQPEQALATLGDDGSAEAWRLRAAAHLALDTPDQALAAFEMGLAAGGSVRLIHDYAHYRLQSSDLAGARTLVEQLRVLAPQGYETLYVQGELAAAEGNASSAEGFWKEASRRYPSRYEPVFALAELASNAGKSELALKLVEQASQLSPGNKQVASIRIQLLSENGEWEKVRDLLQQHESELAPGSAEGMTYAEALLRLGHAEQARSFYVRALLLNPQNRYARMMLGEAQLATGDAAGAWETLKPLAAGVLGMRRELELAEKAARAAGSADAPILRQRLQSSNMQRAETLSGQGQAALGKRDWKAAMNAFRQLSALGDDPQVFKRLAFAMSQSGLTGEAIATADKALAMQPDDPDLSYMAGFVRLNGRTDLEGAVRLLSQAAAADPKNQTYRNDLAQAKAAAG